MSEIFWSPNLAYITGLLVTDGNLSKDGRHITMRSSDIDLLQTFNYCLNTTVSIRPSYNNGYAKRPSYRLQFSHVSFYRWLLSIGLTPAKTYTIGGIEVPDAFFRDFLRGHLDGDGSVFTYIDRYNRYKGRTYTNYRVCTVFISVSEKHIRWLYQKINQLTGLKGSLTSKAGVNSKSTMWSIKFSKKESIKLLEWMYYEPNLPCLQRKEKLAQQILNQVKNEQRRKYTKVIS